MEQVASVAGDSLFLMGRGYKRRGKRELQYDGQRPGPGWHAHGYFSRQLLLMVAGQVVQFVLFKQRWLEVQTGRTIHSRPPDDPPLISCNSLVVVLLLLSWLGRGLGVHCFEGILPGLERCVSARTVQRYLAKCLPYAMTIQQNIRRAVMERCEPRPWEQLFPNGLSPPHGLLRRQWKALDAVTTLHRGLVLLLGGAVSLGIHASVLLTEARREVPAEHHSLLI
jgi:hypothetical protein